MTTLYLIRHAANDTIGVSIPGRTPGIGLNAEGRRQAESLATHLAKEPIQLIISSPLERSVETAMPLARKLNLDVEISDALLEVDFGDWSRQTLEQLNTVPKWGLWNSFRSGQRVPNGEMMIEVQARMVGAVQLLHAEYPNGTIALFGHGDPIRSVLAYYLGVPLDLFQRIELSPAAVSILTLDDTAPKILCMNR
ncbi:histidine phosphatase family protein [Pedosphaera parvula]|uniref:Phosphoglycerate mutase n=1 Tax=Pedosphaera parvula (strain Ellin514) TaxID=320771 RepID=B9XN78_PEDPL|nr:histidine phosphatase family protein [Pedosphaera parvula]EEF58740.1 Phosphoglycerate mutase [Pedosphaera parvula Ellin514]